MQLSPDPSIWSVDMSESGSIWTPIEFKNNFILYSSSLKHTQKLTCKERIEFLEIYWKMSFDRGLLERCGAKDIRWKYRWDMPLFIFHRRGDCFMVITDFTFIYSILSTSIINFSKFLGILIHLMQAHSLKWWWVPCEHTRGRLVLAPWFHVYT